MSNHTKIDATLDCGTDETLVSIEYNDYQGGDSGHGGFLNISIDFSKNGIYEIEPRKIAIKSKGDWEKKAMVKTLLFVADSIRSLEE